MTQLTTVNIVIVKNKFLIAEYLRA